MIKPDRAKQAVLSARPASTTLNQRHARAWAALGLAWMFGYVDGVTLIKLGVFTSFMTGNTTTTGVRIVQENYATAGASLLPIPAFVVGAALGTLFQTWRAIDQTRVFFAAAALLATSVVAASFAAPDWNNVVLLSAAMGMLATTLVSIDGQSASFGFITGDLKNLGAHIGKGLMRSPVNEPTGPSDTHWLRAALMASVWTSFFVGTVIGATAATRVGAWSLLAPPPVPLACA